MCIKQNFQFPLKLLNFHIYGQLLNVKNQIPVIHQATAITKDNGKKL